MASVPQTDQHSPKEGAPREAAESFASVLHLT